MCADHFQKMLVDNPVRANTREELVYYICDIHNQVNERLNKTKYDCKKAFEIWGGDCGCEPKEDDN